MNLLPNVKYSSLRKFFSQFCVAFHFVCRRVSAFSVRPSIALLVLWFTIPSTNTKCLSNYMRQHVLQHAIKSEHGTIYETHKHRESHTISHIASVIITIINVGDVIIYMVICRSFVQIYVCALQATLQHTHGIFCIATRKAPLRSVFAISLDLFRTFLDKIVLLPNRKPYRRTSGKWLWFIYYNTIKMRNE